MLFIGTRQENMLFRPNHQPRREESTHVDVSANHARLPVSEPGYWKQRFMGQNVFGVQNFVGPTNINCGNQMGNSPVPPEQVLSKINQLFGATAGPNGQQVQNPAINALNKALNAGGASAISYMDGINLAGFVRENSAALSKNLTADESITFNNMLRQLRVPNAIQVVGTASGTESAYNNIQPAMYGGQPMGQPYTSKTAQIIGSVGNLAMGALGAIDRYTNWLRPSSYSRSSYDNGSSYGSGDSYGSGSDYRNSSSSSNSGSNSGGEELV